MIPFFRSDLFFIHQNIYPINDITTNDIRAIKNTGSDDVLLLRSNTISSVLLTVFISCSKVATFSTVLSGIYVGVSGSGIYSFYFGRWLNFTGSTSLGYNDGDISVSIPLERMSFFILDLPQCWRELFWL